jgi:hypothetical protein
MRLFAIPASGFQIREGDFRLREGDFCFRASGIRLAEGENRIRESGNQMAEGVATPRAGLSWERRLSDAPWYPGIHRGHTAKAFNACGRM